MQAVSPQKELISKNNNSGWWYHLNVVTWLLSDQSLVTKPTNLTQRVASLFAYLGIWVQLENFPESVYMVMIDDSTQEVSWEKDIILGTKNWNQLANANRPFPSWLVIECWQLFTCGSGQLQMHKEQKTRNKFDRCRRSSLENWPWPENFALFVIESLSIFCYGAYSAFQCIRKLSGHFVIRKLDFLCVNVT